MRCWIITITALGLLISRAFAKPMAKKMTWPKMAAIFVIALAVVALVLFVPAGTLDYWQAWVFLAALFVPFFFVASYLMLASPEFLERRMRTKEKEATQKTVVKLFSLLFFLGFLVPGLDRRYGWSHVPPEWSIAANVLMIASYAFIFWVFRENVWAGRTVQVDKGQKVVSTGPYAIVRHPMYAGQIAMFMAIPIALGSWYALPFFIAVESSLILRILNEEDVLRRELPGYKAYCKKTKYRLIPLVW